MAQAQPAEILAFAKADPIFARLRSEAEEALAREPELAGFIRAAILNLGSLGEIVADRVAARLDHAAVPGSLIRAHYLEALAEGPGLIEAIRADILAVADRDPACTRLAHWMWGRGRRDFALYLQSRSSEVFQTDIHPAAVIGKGIFLDHATGLVVGSTATIDDDVSILQDVTLGGTGKERGDRHPKIRQGVLIGAGAKILGNIEVGRCARVAAGSVVLSPVPNNKTVAGVPARVVGEAGCAEPARSMDQLLADKLDP